MCLTKAQAHCCLCIENTWPRGGGWGRCWGQSAGLHGPQPPTAPQHHNKQNGSQQSRCNTVPTVTAVLGPNTHQRDTTKLVILFQVKSGGLQCCCFFLIFFINIVNSPLFYDARLARFWGESFLESAVFLNFFVWLSRPWCPLIRLHTSKRTLPIVGGRKPPFSCNVNVAKQWF